MVEIITTLNSAPYMYNPSYDVITELQNVGDLNNKLFATFTNYEGLDGLLKRIQNKYSILYNKIFVLEIVDKDEYVVTYNVDQGNVHSIIDNTILVHRKKESNTLYSLNGLNEIIKSLNGGVVDNSFRINWQNYKNSILLTQEGELKTLKTKIYKIVEI